MALKRLDCVMQTSDCNLQINLIFGNNHVTGARVNIGSVGEFICVYNTNIRVILRGGVTRYNVQ